MCLSGATPTSGQLLPEAQNPQLGTAPRDSGGVFYDAWRSDDALCGALKSAHPPPRMQLEYATSTGHLQVRGHRFALCPSRSPSPTHQHNARLPRESSESIFKHHRFRN